MTLNKAHLGKAIVIGTIGILVLWLTTACGVNLNHKVSGGAETKSTVDVKVVHQMDLENLRVYFASTCQEKLPADRCYDPDVETCVNCELGDFLARVQ